MAIITDNFVILRYAQSSKPANNGKRYTHIAYVLFYIESLPEDELENVRKNVTNLKRSLALFLEEAFCA